MKKGVTMVTLVVLAVVLLILVSLTTVAIMRNLENTQKMEFTMELNVIKSEIDTFKDKNGTYPITAEVMDISNISDSMKDKFYDEFANNNSSLSVIDLSKLNIKNLKYGLGSSLDDKYLVSNITGKVYYLKGVKIGDETYYCANEELTSLISGDKKLEKNSSEGILFKEEKENDKLLVNVLVPKTYLRSSVTFEGKTVDVSKVTDSYYTYKVVTEKNGTIIVSYRDENQDKIAKYIVYKK